MTWSHAFSRAWRRLHVFASRSDWSIVLFTFLLIGLSNYFGLVLRHSIENRSNTNHVRITAHLYIKQTVKNKNHQSLERIKDGEDVLEDDGTSTEAEEPKHPRDSKQGKNNRGGLDTSSDFLDLRLALYVSRSHHLTNN